MTADARYIIEADIRTVGSFATGLALADPKLRSMHDSLGKIENQLRDSIPAIIGGKFTAAFEAVAGKMWDITKMAGTAALGAGIAGVTYGVLGLNKELENTSISLGAVFRAQELASTVSQGLEQAGSIIKEMRKDARDLPGEFEDLKNVYQTAAVPAFHGGLSEMGWEKMSAKVMATAKAVSLPMDQAAREFAGLLEGRAGAHNVFGMRLLGLSGESAQAFNKLTDAERVKRLSAELDKYGESIAVFSGGMEAQTSTLVDNAKQFVLEATKPLFNDAKGALKDINHWFDSNEALVGSWADYIGSQLHHAFEVGESAIEKWWPIVKNFAEMSWERLSAVWTKIQPYVERFGQALQKALEDPNGTIDKLIYVAELYAGLKIAGGLFEGAVAIGNTVALLKTLGMIGGAGGAAAAGAGAAAEGAGAGIAAEGATVFATGFMGTVWPVIAGLMTSGDSNTKVQDQKYQEYIASVRKSADEEWAADLARAGGDIFGATELYSRSIAQHVTSDDELTARQMELAMMAGQLTADFDGLSGSVANLGNAISAGIADRALSDVTLGTTQMVRNYLSGQGGKANKAKHPGGGGGTNIQKVEIVVTNNQNPSRVARTIRDELAKLGRNPNASRFAPNFSALSRG